MTKRFVLVLLLAALAGCGGDEAQGIGTPITVSKGFDSAISSARTQAVYTDAEWTTLWGEHAPGTLAPAVDFPDQMVLAAFHGGIQALFVYEVSSVVESGGSLVVTVHRTLLGTNCGSTTGPLITPYHVVRVRRSDLPVTVQTTTDYFNC